MRLTAPIAAGAMLSVGRGLRSAVGTYGFAFGGLIIEQGKAADDALSPLVYRLDVPDDWRFALIQPLCAKAYRGSTKRPRLPLCRACRKQPRID